MNNSKIAVIFLLASLFTFCEKDPAVCMDDVTFCAFTETNNFDLAAQPINKFLKSLQADLTDAEKVEKLREWLQCKSCVQEAEILCVSCIETNPPQSEIKVLVYLPDGTVEEFILDILMDDPPQFFRHH